MSRYLQAIYNGKPIFARYGGLSAVKQKGYGKANTFHSPPARKGIYAFVLPFLDLFLVGSMEYSSNKYSKLRDKQGNYIEATYHDSIGYIRKHPDFDRLNQNNKTLEVLVNRDEVNQYHDLYDYCEDADIPILMEFSPSSTFRVIKRQRPRKFNHVGHIWSHLQRLPNTTILGRNGSWIKTDIYDYCEMLKVEMKERLKLQASYRENPRQFLLNNGVCNDNLEVFIEKVKES